mmetsp:Transcript_82720/g.237720  ORF Transcript_82720/g.237720 Transcript_82720/m.237720 type:complete len:219 (-) Transcript_82720:253-909(-)|eukprot:CAMPEP_0177223770 /NCGR_PEP_ID=MMETSP0367-20130122/38664_1 /TAXON_ID=447022 ORGANISM="Scrippsiella hangoei-like, Strain SHHI-4" /NCGR_SAMPLE_ID=MMETSP0367 /ASSEMBLY_ACC=CAM_ASM_000362 /LENGTH=218 /DNA_ID=CAMNT_0018673767 /DNA_START=36 /DNA_END=692 /DNA_ORIENTATION=+
MPRGETRRIGIEDFPPNPLQYAGYLDKVSTHHRAAAWKVSRTESDGALHMKTAADRYEPGQYRVDRDFVEDKKREVRKGVLTSYESPKLWTFDKNSRTDSDGVLVGVRNPGNMKNWFNPTAPGQYDHGVGTLQKAASYSQRKGEPQENIRERRMAQSNPGPGQYELPSKFDTMRQRREAQHGTTKHAKVCRWESQFKHMFACIQPKAQNQVKMNHAFK